MVKKFCQLIICFSLLWSCKPIGPKGAESNFCFLNEVNTCLNQKDWQSNLESSINSFIVTDSLEGGLEMNFLHNETINALKKEGFTPVKNELLDTLFSLCKSFMENLGSVKDIISYQLVINGEYRNLTEIVLIRFKKKTVFFEINNLSDSQNKLVISENKKGTMDKIKDVNFRFEAGDEFYDGYLVLSYFSFQNEKYFVNYSVAPTDRLIKSISLLMSNKLSSSINLNELKRKICK